MGANFEWIDIEAKNADDAIKRAETYQEQAIVEYGNNPYSGHLGTSGVGVVETWPTKTFETRDEAIEWVENESDKWSYPYLVRYKQNDKIMFAVGGWCAS